MIRQLGLLALLLPAFLIPREAFAVQLFIDQSFVNWIENPLPVAPGAGDCYVTGAPGPLTFLCGANSANPVSFGNISNEPHIEFDRAIDADECLTTTVFPLPAGTHKRNYCNSQVFLCAAVGYSNEQTTPIALSELSFQLFKFQDGSNPTDPASTPPLRTFFLDAPGIIPASCTSGTAPFAGCASNGGVGTTDGPTIGPLCVIWDGNVNIQGEQGKTNGTYGFRVEAKTNTSGPSGNIQITTLRAYPAGATQDANGDPVSQKPITVDVTNIHVVRSSPSLVGNITPVTALPYNINYRIAKDANMTVTVANNAGANIIRTVVPGLPKVGEGIPNGTLLNGDSWNGRHDNGDLMPPGVFLTTLQAESIDQYGRDLSHAVTRQIAIDPLQITDIRVQPLLAGSTALAILTYQLTEPATVYIDIYPPGTQFCRAQGFNNVNDTSIDQTPGAGDRPPKNFSPSNDGCATQTFQPIRRIVEQKTARTDVVSFWDGRDRTGVIQDDGDYVFVIYAALPSRNGYDFNGVSSDRRIWTTRAISGFLPIIRGLVGITQVAPGTSVIGSSPPISGLNPFLFRYTLSREAFVTMKVFDESGTTLIKTLVDNQVRPGNFPNQERWDEPTTNNGQWLSSGTFLVQLTAADTQLPAKVSTTTALFPVNLFRIVDVFSTPLLTGASDFASISYQLSQPMIASWKIYAPGTQILNTATQWPPCGAVPTPNNCASVVGPDGVTPVNPIFTFTQQKAGRFRLTDFWDGRDINGLFVPDGNYVFTLTARSTTTPIHLVQDRAFGSLAVARGQILFNSFTVQPDVPQLFNSSSTITLHPFTISYALNRQSSVTVQILNTAASPQVIRTLFSGNVKDGGILLQEVWDGRDNAGNFPPAGFYNVRAIATDVASVLSNPSTAQVTISYDPLRIYDVAVTPLRFDGPGTAEVRYQVSETMKVALKIYRPGTVFDSNGNPSPPESTSLVKRIVGVRQPRTEIIESWDGTDLRRAISPEGSYKFKIVASTDVNAIDSLTGNVISGSALSLDRPIDDIPVIRGFSADPISDFENNTFAYPNPSNGPTMTFAIWSPFQSKANMRIYTMNGELVYERDFGEIAAETYFGGQNGFVWNKVNQAGRKVARGVYLVVIRLQETLGGKNVMQTVKKVIIQ
jgi:flagellar hook assembly protein FlgD